MFKVLVVFKKIKNIWEASHTHQMEFETMAEAETAIIQIESSPFAVSCIRLYDSANWVEFCDNKDADVNEARDFKIIHDGFCIYGDGTQTPTVTSQGIGGWQCGTLFYRYPKAKDSILWQITREGHYRRVFVTDSEIRFAELEIEASASWVLDDYFDFVVRLPEESDLCNSIEFGMKP